LSEESDPDDDFLSQWESIIADADIHSVPLKYLRSIDIKMFDGTEEIFDVLELSEQGLSIEEIEALLESFVEEHDEEIDTLDFHLNVKAVANDIKNRTKRFLG